MKIANLHLYFLHVLSVIIFLFSCDKPEEIRPIYTENISVDTFENYSYLALGDSYTTGEGVASNQSFPEQLKKSLENQLAAKIDVQTIATTGWRTDDLLRVVEIQSSNKKYDFVTLLIGVNNQYQGRPFSQYEQEFPQLLEKAIQAVNNNLNRVFVISIPDYAYTPFGQNQNTDEISNEIDRYNTFAKNTAVSKNVRFVTITDITRRGLDEPNLVAPDGLHPSGDAYEIFVSRIAPFIYSQLKD